MRPATPYKAQRPPKPTEARSFPAARPDGAQAFPDLSAGRSLHIPRHAAELEARRRTDVAWLSRVADGPTGSNLLYAEFAAASVKGFLTRGSSAQPRARVNAQQSRVLLGHAHRCMQELARKDVQSQKIPSQRGFIRQGKADAKGKPVTKVAMADYAKYTEIAIRLVCHANSLLAACTAYTRLVASLPAHVQVDLCKVQGTDHVLVVIGRDPNADPANMSTWGPNAVVCDAWADLCYPLSEYPEMQKPERNVKDLAGRKEHYLGGPLQVLGRDTYLD